LTRRIAILGFDGVQALDLFGPADVFASDVFLGRRLNDELQDHWPPYQVIVIGLTARNFTTSGGVVVRADTVVGTSGQFDTVIVPGGSGIRLPGVAEKIGTWIERVSPRTRRIASVCTGIYGLASTGFLDHRRVTTHWTAARDVAQRFPKLRVDSNALFIRDGKFYTSAGVTAGVDLSLALVEEDEGRAAALAIARELVVYLKRPGGQNQFSELLQYQVAATDRFGELAAWIQSHLRVEMSVEILAARVFLSPRQFARAFKGEFGATPAAFVEAARLAEANRRLSRSGSGTSLKAVARSVGYTSEDVFRRAFERRFGTTPSAYRARFGARSET
jgi:transcriptional regulator GlxA family with amidase domain